MDLVVDTLIEKIERGHADIVRLYQSVPVYSLEETFFSNGWSVKDVVTHLAAWEWRCASILDESHNTNAFLKAEPDVDALNHEFHEERHQWDWEEVEYDFRAAHRALFDAIRKFPPERLIDDIVQQTIAVDTWEHYAKHLSDLEHWHNEVIRKKRVRWR